MFIQIWHIRNQQATFSLMSIVYTIQIDKIHRSPKTEREMHAVNFKFRSIILFKYINLPVYYAEKFTLNKGNQ